MYGSKILQYKNVLLPAKVVGSGKVKIKSMKFHTVLQAPDADRLIAST